MRSPRGGAGSRPKAHSGAPRLFVRFWVAAPLLEAGRVEILRRPASGPWSKGASRFSGPRHAGIRRAPTRARHTPSRGTCAGGFCSSPPWVAISEALPGAGRPLGSPAAGSRGPGVQRRCWGGEGVLILEAGGGVIGISVDLLV